MDRASVSIAPARVIPRTWCSVQEDITAYHAMGLGMLQTNAINALAQERYQTSVI